MPTLGQIKVNNIKNNSHKTVSIREVVKQLKLSCTVGRNQDEMATLEVGVFIAIKYIVTVLSNKSTPRYKHLPKRNENVGPQNICTQMFIMPLFIIAEN